MFTFLGVVFYVSFIAGIYVAGWFFIRSCIVSALKRYDKLKNGNEEKK